MTCDALVSEANYQGQPIAAVAAETFAQARAALALLAVEYEVLEPMLDAEEAVRRKQLLGDARTHDRGDVARGFAEADAVVEATYRTQTVVHNSLETHQSVCDWEGDQLVVYISTQYIWGVRDEVSRRLGLPPTRCASSASTWAAASAEERRRRLHVHCRRACEAHRPSRQVRATRREENIDSGNRNATIQRLRAGARADGTLVALEGEFIAALGWDGWLASTAGPMQMLYACDNVAHGRVRRRSSTRRR